MNKQHAVAIGPAFGLGVVDDAVLVVGTLRIANAGVGIQLRQLAGAGMGQPADQPGYKPIVQGRLGAFLLPGPRMLGIDGGQTLALRQPHHKGHML